MFIEQGIRSENKFWKYLLGSGLIILMSFIGQLPLLVAVIWKTFATGEAYPTTNDGMMHFLDNSKQEYKITKYLEEAPSTETLKALLEKLQIKAIDLVRQKEKIWIENYKNQEMTDEAVIQAMVLHPILIERPIIIKGNKAIIAREMDKIETFFKES